MKWVTHRPSVKPVNHILHLKDMIHWAFEVDDPALIDEVEGPVRPIDLPIQHSYLARHPPRLNPKFTASLPGGSVNQRYPVPGLPLIGKIPYSR
ncbi:hypothetical protein E2C01_058310 [Portunus trituberculatus]|uniref:Uncharacterized protein n=1 Tax=Portunus trituberculatus TaxID=210409 RepID=A0A5B7H2M5_PORTR|nr:hypothetical protein [Portunus trituberculatus]